MDPKEGESFTSFTSSLSLRVEGCERKPKSGKEPACLASNVASRAAANCINVPQQLPSQLTLFRFELRDPCVTVYYTVGATECVSSNKTFDPVLFSGRVTSSTHRPEIVQLPSPWQRDRSRLLVSVTIRRVDKRSFCFKQGKHQLQLKEKLFPPRAVFFDNRFIFVPSV